MDKSYCIIYLVNKEKIVLHMFSSVSSSNIKVYNYPICFTAYSSKLLYRLLLYHYSFCIFSFDHSLYLGKEVYKAGLALSLGQNYIQE